MTQDPFIGVNPIVGALESHRAKLEQVWENTARQAWSYASLTTTGVGEIQHPTVVRFDCTFIEQPKVAHGFSLDGDTLVDGSFPTVSAGVWKWWQDKRGFYLGAYVFFVVTGVASYAIQHDFTFSGIAIKDLPEYLMEG